jgi:PAS domain S-box-containing protein
MELRNYHSNENINTADLKYVHPNGKYNYTFSYMGDGVFFIKSKGFLDEKSFKIQFAAGDVARERLAKMLPGYRYHLIWDVSEVSGASLFARRHIMSKLKGNDNFGSVSIVGANFFVQTYIKLIYNIIPNINFFLFRTIEEATANIENTYKKVLSVKSFEHVFMGSETEAYARFINIWQTSGNIRSIGAYRLRYITRPQWIYQSLDNTYNVEVSVLEGNIIYFKLEGIVKSDHVENTYDIMEKIIEEFQFNQTNNKFYSILDLKKLRGVSLSARKKTLSLEALYHSYAHYVFLRPSNILYLMYKVLKKVGKENFNHWEIITSIEDALTKIQLHQKGNFDLVHNYDQGHKKESLEIPKTKSQILELLQKQYNEIQQLKQNQQEQIQKILSFTGTMSWDESFVPPVILYEENNPFNSVYDSLIILFNDFKEIIEETSLKALQLQESEDKYRNLINLASDVILVYQDDKLRFVNSRVAQVLGYAPEEVLNQSIAKYVTDGEAIKLRNFYEKRIKGEVVPWFYESVFIHKDGHRVPVSISDGSVVFEGKPASMLIIRDITQKKRADEELERYRNHLEDIVRKRTEQLQKEVTDRRIAEESDRLKTAFLSNMSHEIRTPMNAIIGFSNFLKEPGLTREQHDEYVDFIQSSGLSLLNLINDIIDLSKIEAKQLSIQSSFCKVDTLLDELYQLFEQTRKNNHKDHIKLILKIPDRNNLQLNTDPYRLRQIVSNLIDNALKFTDNGFVEFGYTMGKDNVLFYVKDTGIGIPDEKKELIFKRFGRLQSNDRNISGTGLGLAISKNLATLLDGRLWVESEEKCGSIFYLRLPNTNPGASQTEYKESVNDKKDGYNWQGKRVLIAEDEDLNYRVLQIALSRTGVELVRAKNGKEAVAFITEDNTFDIVLMDIQMPEMDGYEAMSLIKNVMPAMPVIAQTAFALLEERKKCLELGFDDYISKPIHFTDLYSKMDVFLKG